MALEFIDGFDHYTQTGMMARKWSASSPFDSGAGFVTGRFGAGNAFKLHWNTSVPFVNVGSLATRIVGFAANFQGANQNYQVFAFRDSGTVQVDLRMTTTGALQVTRNGTVLATTSNTISAGQWYYVEFQVTINSSAGSFTLQITTPGGIASTWASGSGVNTQSTGNASTNEIAFIGYANNSNDTYIDDLYCLNTSGSVNNTFLGDSRIVTNLPNADGASTQWTPSTGSTHYNLVNEANPNDDTNYVNSATAGQLDLYKYPSISISGAIAGVQITMCARKDDAGARTVSAEYRSAGGTNYAGGSSFNPTPGYLMYRQVYDTDPATGSQWTLSGVNNGQFGVNCVA